MTTQFETQAHYAESLNVSNYSFVDILTNINRVLEIKDLAGNSNSGDNVLQHGLIASLSLYPASSPKHFIKVYNSKKTSDANKLHQRCLYGSLSLDSETKVLAN